MEDLVPALQQLWSSSFISNWLHRHKHCCGLAWSPTGSGETHPLIPAHSPCYQLWRQRQIELKQKDTRASKSGGGHNTDYSMRFTGLQCTAIHFSCRQMDFEKTLAAASWACSFLCKTSSRGELAFLPQLWELFGRRVGWWDIGTQWQFLSEAVAGTMLVSSFQAWPPTDAAPCRCEPLC